MDFVNFEIAKKLKEKGYPQRTFGEYDMLGACYIEDGRFYENGCITEVARAYTAPTISQVWKWLRDIKKIDVLPQRGHIAIDNNSKVTRYYNVNIYFERRFACTLDNGGQDYSTYEKAAITGIEYVVDCLI